MHVVGLFINLIIPLFLLHLCTLLSLLPTYIQHTFWLHPVTIGSCIRSHEAQRMWILRARYVSCYGVFHRSSVLFYLTWGSHNCRRLIHIHSETPPGVQSQPPQPLRASDTVCVALTGESLKLDSNIEEIISLKMAPQPLEYIN